MLDQIAGLFVIPPNDRQPSWSHARGLLGIGLLSAASCVFMLLIPAIPLSFVGEPFSVLRHASTFAGVAIGLAAAVAFNRRPVRRPWGAVGAVVAFMLYQPVRGLGPELLALYHGSAAGVIAWFAAYTFTLAAIDARELRRAGASETCPAAQGSQSEDLDFWDRD